ncbi:cellulose biosynthesis cyclic di-GMP-binding regulatory protein BcsB, partial [Enterobacter kobei]|nr:cellulose biosynthesis cyclic di-GMP-binding regulatory protein BcsB [Enterobacter kobei]
LIVMPKQPNPAQLTTLLDTAGTIGAQTGFPAVNLTITNEGGDMQKKDADILVIGALPASLKDEKRIDMLVNATQSWVKTLTRDVTLIDTDNR